MMSTRCLIQDVFLSRLLPVGMYTTLLGVESVCEWCLYSMPQSGCISDSSSRNTLCRIASSCLAHHCADRCGGGGACVLQAGRSLITDLSTDLRDGTSLLSLLEVLSGLVLVSVV